MNGTPILTMDLLSARSRLLTWLWWILVASAIWTLASFAYGLFTMTTDWSYEVTNLAGLLFLVLFFRGIVFGKRIRGIVRVTDHRLDLLTSSGQTRLTIP
jgi:hypothetical protein